MGKNSTYFLSDARKSYVIYCPFWGFFIPISVSYKLLKKIYFAVALSVRFLLSCRYGKSIRSSSYTF